MGRATAAPCWWLAFAAALTLLTAGSINQFTKRIASTGSLYTFTVRGLGIVPGLSAGVALLIGYAFVSMFSLAGVALYATQLLGGVLPQAGVIAALLVAGCALGALLLGVKVSARIVLVVELIAVAIVLVFFVIVLLQGSPSLVLFHFDPFVDGPGPIVVGTALAVTAFVGFESSASLAVETRRPLARVPRAITSTVLAAGVLYLIAGSAQVTGFATLGESLGDATSPVNTLAARFGSPFPGPVLDAAVIASFFACALASTTALVRVLFTMSREGVLPRSCGRVHPRRLTPHLATLAAVPTVAAVPIIALLAGAAPWHLMQVLILVAAAGYLTAYVLCCAAVPAFLTRIGERTTRATVQAIAAALLLATCLVAYLVVESQGERAVGVVVFAGLLTAGVIWTRFLTRRSLAKAIGIYDEPVHADVHSSGTSE